MAHLKEKKEEKREKKEGEGKGCFASLLPSSLKMSTNVHTEKD